MGSDRRGNKSLEGMGCEVVMTIEKLLCLLLHCPPAERERERDGVGLEQGMRESATGGRVWEWVFFPVGGARILSCLRSIRI